MKDLPRLIFLAEEHRIPVPKSLIAFISHGKLLSEIAEKGLNGVSVNDDISIETLHKFYDRGRKSTISQIANRGTPEEYRLLVGRVALGQLELTKDEYSLERYLDNLALVRDYVIFGSDELVNTEEASFIDEPDEGLVKWPLGLQPFDELIPDGYYQGMLTLMGISGEGKTSLMLAMLEALRKSGVATSSIFLEVEIPKNLMLWRATPLKERFEFTEKDRLLTGAFTTRQIIQMIQEDPDPNRVVFIDGPDAMTAGIHQGRRQALESIYKDMMRIKAHSKLVVISSQARRGDAVLTLESVAESWGKAWFSDIVITAKQEAPLFSKGQSVKRLQLKCVKNRFGIDGLEVVFDFDYQNLAVLDCGSGWDFDLGGK